MKNINGTVHCDGDSWRVDKCDRYGNLVEQYSIGDRGARHRRSKVGVCRRATVSIFTAASEVTRLLTKVRQPFDPARRAKLEDLIIRDHRHHARRGR